MNTQAPRLVELIANKPCNPLFAFRPRCIEQAANLFTSHFNGDVIYAVKTNPESYVIKLINKAGINKFDVASLAEIAQIRAVTKQATLYFMNPVKPRETIRTAYFDYGVRHFSLDSQDELNKILFETNHAPDLNLFLRIAIPNTYAEIDLSKKFGITLQQAPALLKQIKQHAFKVGICFHVGSQCMHPNAYRIAVKMINSLLREHNQGIDFLNVGGGFPAIYPGMSPPPLCEYFQAIHEEFALTPNPNHTRLLCEPGRALVAESTSLIVRVELRKGDALYINDGTYGNLFDAGIPGFIFPVQLIRTRPPQSNHLIPFKFYGPTCDSLDCMNGPFYLPEDIKEGDYIEIGQLGAYGKALASSFNGFKTENTVVTTSDPPLLSMYTAPLLTEKAAILAA